MRIACQTKPLANFSQILIGSYTIHIFFLLLDFCFDIFVLSITTQYLQQLYWVPNTKKYSNEHKQYINTCKSHDKHNCTSRLKDNRLIQYISNAVWQFSCQGSHPWLFQHWKYNIKLSVIALHPYFLSSCYFAHSNVDAQSSVSQNQLKTYFPGFIPDS